MDFSTVKDSQDFILIPEGTVVEAMIGKIEAKLGKDNPERTVLHVEFQVSSPEFMYVKLKDYMVIDGMAPEKLEFGKGKVKRMLEYGRDASPTNLHGYVVPEIMGGNGKHVVKWSELVGMKVGLQVKVDSFVSDRDGTTLYSNKVGSYASKNSESGGYKLYNAISKGEQPWQKPLPDMNKPTKSNSQPAGMSDFEIPIEAY